jgi:hypothetical protein
MDPSSEYQGYDYPDVSSGQYGGDHNPLARYNIFHNYMKYDSDNLSYVINYLQNEKIIETFFPEASFNDMILPLLEVPDMDKKIIKGLLFTLYEKYAQQWNIRPKYNRKNFTRIYTILFLFAVLRSIFDDVPDDIRMGIIKMCYQYDDLPSEIFQPFIDGSDSVTFDINGSTWYDAYELLKESMYSPFQIAIQWNHFHKENPITNFTDPRRIEEHVQRYGVGNRWSFVYHLLNDGYRFRGVEEKYKEIPCTVFLKYGSILKGSIRDEQYVLTIDETKIERAKKEEVEHALYTLLSVFIPIMQFTPCREIPLIAFDFMQVSGNCFFKSCAASLAYYYAYTYDMLPPDEAGYPIDTYEFYTRVNKRGLAHLFSPLSWYLRAFSIYALVHREKYVSAEYLANIFVHPLINCLSDPSKNAMEEFRQQHNFVYELIERLKHEQIENEEMDSPIVCPGFHRTLREMWNTMGKTEKAVEDIIVESVIPSMLQCALVIYRRDNANITIHKPHNDIGSANFVLPLGYTGSGRAGHYTTLSFTTRALDLFHTHLQMGYTPETTKRLSKPWDRARTCANGYHLYSLDRKNYKTLSANLIACATIHM